MFQPVSQHLPPPYSMCSREECEERSINREISVFERDRTNGSTTVLQLDPQRAVSKYRRSAAGSDDMRSLQCLRSLLQLDITVQYLINLIVSYNISTGTTVDASFLNLVDFVENRLRRVQVDLIKSQKQSKIIQRKIAGLQIVLLYLLADCNNKDCYYEHKFGESALQTALSNYWNGPTSVLTTTTTMDDEILSLSILILLNNQLLILKDIGDNDDVTMPIFSFGLSELYRKHCGNAHRTYGIYLSWTLHLASLLVTGHWQSAICWLQQNPSMVQNNDNIPLSTSFWTLALCSLGPSLNYLRMQAIATWRKSLGTATVSSQIKSEGLAVNEFARMLGLEEDIDAAVNLATSTGLIVQEDCVRFTVERTQSYSTMSSIRKSADSLVLSSIETTASRRLTAEGIDIPSMEWMRQVLLSV